MLRFALILAALLPAPAFAQEAATISVEVVQETPPGDPGGERFVAEGRADATSLNAIAAFGPFRVLDGGRAALVASARPSATKRSPPGSPGGVS